MTTPPGTSFTTTSATFTIAGTVEPGASDTVATSTAASDGPATVTGGTWSYEIIGLVTGTNSVKVIATDAADNSRAKSLTITKR